jgi:hypothetical protein
MVVEGTIFDLDMIAREVHVLVQGQVLDLDVPTGCPVVVNKEQVKLRLLQRMDRVMVQFKNEGNRAIAQSIEVRSLSGSLTTNHPQVSAQKEKNG